MAEHSWQYMNSRIPLDQLVANIQVWAQSGGYTGKVKKKKDESVFVINQGPSAWKGKVTLTITGTEQMFNVRLDTGKTPFESMANALQEVIKHYTGAEPYTPPVQPVMAPVQPQPQPQPQPVVQPQPEPQPVVQPQPEPQPQPVQPQPEAPPPPAEPQKPVCPTCNNEATYIDQYQRWYCYNCQKYL